MERGAVHKGRFPVPVDRDQVARDWASRGYGCDLFVDPRGRQWNGFVHETNELVAVVEGRLGLRVGSDHFVAEAGDEVYIPGGTEHDVHNLHDETTYWLYGYD